MIASTPAAKRGRPRIEPKGRTMAEQLDAMERRLRRLCNGQRRQSETDEALRRFATTGEAVIPMSVEHVRIVLNFKSRVSVNNLVSKRRLVRRFGRTGFHPDDVRAYLATTGPETPR